MTKRKDTFESKDTPVSSDAAPVTPAIKSELPVVDSPSISPAIPFIGPVKPVPTIDVDPAPTNDDAPSVTPPAAKSRFALSRRQRRSVLLAASVVFAAGFGAVIGAIANASFAPPPPKADTAALTERKAMQRTITHLSKEMTAIKSASVEASSKAAKEIAALKSNLDAANKTAGAQLAKAAARIDEMEHQVQARAAAPETTGSIGTQHAAAEAAAASAKVPIVRGWIVRDARNGYVYVQGRSGIYQVVPGATLPGLGTVETIKRQDGRWVVVTPKGIIVSMRDRPYFAPY